MVFSDRNADKKMNYSMLLDEHDHIKILGKIISNKENKWTQYLLGSYSGSNIVARTFISLNIVLTRKVRNKLSKLFEFKPEAIF